MPALSQIVQLEEVSYAYPKSEVASLKNINLGIHDGEFIGLIGPSGAGKTTLCKLLNGIVPQFHGGDFWGEALALNHDLTNTPISQLSRVVGSVFQDPETQLVCSTVELETAFVLENLAFPREQIRERVAWAIESVGLTGFEQTHPADLSGGQQQRLALAAVLAVKPRLLVLDEPTSQLDPTARADVFALLDKLRREHNMTILIASHAHEELATYANRIVLLQEGRIQKEASPEVIYSDLDSLKQARLRCPDITRAASIIFGQAFVLENKISTLEAAKPYFSTMAERLQHSSESPHSAPTVASPEALIEVDHIAVTYPNGTHAIKELTMRIYPGECLVIVGQNGSGKSTLLKSLLNLVPLDKGEIRFRGETIADLKTSHLAQSIAYLPQNPDHQIFNNTVEKEVRFALENLDLPEPEIVERTEKALTQMGLSDYKEAHPLSLPRGERSRLVFAAVLATDPKIILLDEPTVGQDHASAIRILEVAQGLQANGIAVVIVTHHLTLMPGYATRCVAIENGRNVFDGSLSEAFSLLGIPPLDSLAPTQTTELARQLSRHTGFELKVTSPDDLTHYVQTPHAPSVTL